MQRRKRPPDLAHIRVVGIGSGGRTAVNNLITAGILGVDFITIDSDAEALCESKAPLSIRIDSKEVDLFSAGGMADRASLAAGDTLARFSDALYGSDLVFVAAGLGGKTGSEIAPLVAHVARQQKALVIGIVTYPFSFEGQERATAAKKGIANLRNHTDTLIVIPNDRLLQIADGAVGFHETYRLANDIWRQSIQGVSELINRSGLINVDFADVRTIMSEGGAAVIATGQAKGVDRARKAAEQATHSDLLGITIDGAHGVLFNVTGGPDMTLLEVKEAAAIITRRTHREANVIFGATVDNTLRDELKITVIATGFGFFGGGLRSGMARGETAWQLRPTPLDVKSLGR